MDYSFLRDRGMCVPILIFLGQDPSKWIGGWDIRLELKKRAAPVYIALTLLWEEGLIKDRWIGEGQDALREYSITQEGLEALAQLNT